MMRRHEIIKITAAIAAALATTSPGHASESSGAKRDRALSDGAIEAEVQSELLLDPGVELSNVTVRVNDGIATLSGRLDSLGERNRAVKVTQTVRGVRSVLDRTSIPVRSELSAARLTSRVEQALLRNPATESFEIEARATDDGTVTLEGAVDSWREKELAETVVSAVAGVTELSNQLSVAVVTGRTDSEMKAEIEEALRWDALVDERSIDVQVQDGTARLSGAVGSSAERSEAVYDAYVRGIRRVDDSGLTVVSWARDRMQQQPNLKDVDDSELEAALETALSRDPRVDASKVEPSVRSGVVSLQGRVDSLTAKRTAAGIARRTTGVLAVNDALTVKPTSPRADDVLRSDVRQALAAHPSVDELELSVKVDDGVVTLAGRDASTYQKLRASRIAEDVLGVVRVDNDIEVTSNDALPHRPYADDVYIHDYAWYDYQPREATQPDVEIAAEIRDELWWSPFVDSEEVAILVDDGIVTLTGVVDSWTEREAATENAYEGGAVWVDNDLGVR